MYRAELKFITQHSLQINCVRFKGEMQSHGALKWEDPAYNADPLVELLCNISPMVQVLWNWCREIDTHFYIFL